MRYYKTYLILFLLGITAFLLKIFLFTSTVKIDLHKEDIYVSSFSVKLSGNVIPYFYDWFKLSVELRDREYEYKLLPEEIVLLKKGQVYKFNNEYLLPELHSVDKLKLIFSVERLSNKKKNFKQFTINLPSITEHVISVSTQVEKVETVEKVSQEPVEKKHSIEVVKKEVRETSHPEHKFDIKISTDKILSQYFYDENIQLVLKIENRSMFMIKSTVNVILHDQDRIYFSTQTFFFRIDKKSGVEELVNIGIPHIFPPGKYFISIESFTENIKKSLPKIVEFVLTDREPNISLPELPETIKYKSVNTIFVEVKDDRGIKTVEFVHVDTKTKKEEVSQMILVSGDKKHGLYSYTTPVIKKKGEFKFYILVEDIGGNKTKTEEYILPVK